MHPAPNWVQWFPLHMVGHVAIAAICGWWVTRRTGRAWCGWVCATASLLVDLDHVVDYLGYYGWQHLSWEDFVGGHYARETGRVYLWGHAWEWVAALFLMSWWKPRLAVAPVRRSAGRQALALALAIGLAGHLVWDTFDHREYLGKNILVYRLAHGFAAAAILPPETQRRMWGEVRWPQEVTIRSTTRRVHAAASLPLTALPTTDR